MFLNKKGYSRVSKKKRKNAKKTTKMCMRAVPRTSHKVKQYLHLAGNQITGVVAPEDVGRQLSISSVRCVHLASEGLPSCHSIIPQACHVGQCLGACSAPFLNRALAPAMSPIS